MKKASPSPNSMARAPARAKQCPPRSHIHLFSSGSSPRSLSVAMALGKSPWTAAAQLPHALVRTEIKTWLPCKFPKKGTPNTTMPPSIMAMLFQEASDQIAKVCRSWSWGATPPKKRAAGTAWHSGALVHRTSLAHLLGTRSRAEQVSPALGRLVSV